ncbi:MarR family winged helix-turn-helix transcriptional regulator [Romboutsia sp. 1001713B170207_170306_H8]|uniref:MarR family winged helix-turn-helix transcriptional regulator n=1 Tax=Romboutsia sp. 1001713B170207_170306_H8 TaxID=2787112 RepID=UPI001896DC11|nr:MarR family transcriptional regulator [Romboutsia sp. 1001713B170207_170306_H8]
MDVFEDKSRELLSVITRINKLTHHGFRKRTMPNREFMLLKAINCLKDHNNSNGQFFKGVKASDLSKYSMITKPAISKLINTLEEKGFVERVADKSDRRVVYVNLTNSGEEILIKENQMFEEFTQKVVEKMGEKDTDEMIRLFKKMYDSIVEIKKENQELKEDE